MHNQREVFEEKFPVPEDVIWMDRLGAYVQIIDGAWRSTPYENYWRGWQAATEQGVREPVGFMFEDDFKKLETTECCTDIYSVEAGHPDKGQTTVKLYAIRPPEQGAGNNAGD